MVSSFSFLSGIRIILTIAMLGYASYKDVKTREVNDLIWIIFGGLSLLFDGYEIVVGTLGWQSLGVAVGFSLAFSIFAGYLGFFGGADLLAFIVIALLNPTSPQIVFTPLAFPSVLFVLTVISDSIVIGASTALFVLVLNIGSSRSTKLFEGYPTADFGTKLLLLLTGRRKEFTMIRGPPFEYPLEKMNDDGSVSLHVRPDLSDDSTALETIKELQLSGRRRIWVSYSLPFLLVLCVGYICAIVFGDFLLWLMSVIF